ncbi:glycoside hydrolase family 65 protein [Shewanella woodyi]|uniref:Kojibiose phosphorylase n=1 Tax=Shewanella woodyi (strain ATCC 51908 / MS32) TaxID=392500 RepID=B1KJQ6_SHEWM|nr:glycosyl hydrolase family 65 protein [Shewanella woodyi]ACA85729.1 Kojibiose phosphorylase [Shewanella woodyi ATCC 51908]
MNTLSNEIVLNKSKQWLLSSDELSHLGEGVVETLLSLGNGFIGTRGTSGYKSPITNAEIEGTYINGAFTKEVIEYDETAYGFAKFNNKMLQVENTKQIEISDGEEIFQPISRGEKVLDIYHATLKESLLLSTKQGKTIKLNITRTVCQHQQDLMLNHYQIEPVNFTGKLSVTSYITADYLDSNSNDDPRVGNLSNQEQLTLMGSASTLDFSYRIHQLDSPKSLVIAADRHEFYQSQLIESSAVNEASSLGTRFDLMLNDTGAEFTKYSVFHCNQRQCHQQKCSVIETSDQIKEALSRSALLGYLEHQQQHRAIMEEFWENSDIQITGEAEHQIAIRLNMLHLNMSAGRNGKSNIAAKGLTGPGYNGHYFWDSEIYITPYFIYTQPHIAKGLLSYRYSGLTQAKQRAQELGHSKAALFPWRTIGGEECSSYFPAGTAQYHINSAIAYAVKHYFSATKDWEFIWQEGAELAIETARLWPSLGHFNPLRDNQFCIDTVTGPDEYTALVNNNYYTNAMAKIHLSFVCDLLALLQDKNSEKYSSLMSRLAVTKDEIALWKKISETLYLPHQAELNLTPQDDSFFSKKAWDFANTPKEKYPLLLHFHPLTIYRHQVLKQADVILANFLQDDRVDINLKRNNLNFYEPLTTHDSTLSACTHSLAYSETGNPIAAFDYFEETLLTDIKNLHHNTEQGVHTAAMAGSWMCITHGFSGLRLREDYVSFTPLLPKQWQDLCFKLALRGCQLKLHISKEKVIYQLISGSELTLKHYSQTFRLDNLHSTKEMLIPEVAQSE